MCGGRLARAARSNPLEIKNETNDCSVLDELSEVTGRGGIAILLRNRELEQIASIKKTGTHLRGSVCH